MQLEAIVVTGNTEEVTQRAWARANGIGLDTTNYRSSPTGGWWSFLIVPDGYPEQSPNGEDFHGFRKLWADWATFEQGLRWRRVQYE